MFDLSGIEENLLEIILERARQYAPNNHLRNAIEGRVERDGLTVNVIVEVPLGPGTMDADAYEHGSGIHNPENPQTYPIEGKPLLVFPWDKADASIPRTKDGRVILSHVNHPGVEAANNGRGYLKPAIEDSFPQIAEITAIELGKGLLNTIRNIFAGGS